MRACTHPFIVAEDQACQPDRSGGHQRWRGGQQPPFQGADFQQVLADGSRFDVVVVGLADTTKEVHWIGERQIPVDGFEHVSLCKQNLGLGVRGVGTVKEVGHGGRNNFLDLRGDEEAGDADELQLGEGDYSRRQEAVNNIYTQEERFG